MRKTFYLAMILMLVCLLFVGCATESGKPAEDTASVKPSESTKPAETDGVSDDEQNSVMSVIGNYVSGRAHAVVEAEGSENVKITVEWGSSAFSMRKWVLVGKLNTESLTVDYNDGVVTDITYEEEDKPEETIVSKNDKGSIVFSKDKPGFIWNDDQVEEKDMIFEWSEE